MKNLINFINFAIMLLVFISCSAFADKSKSGHVVASVQNCPPNACQVFNANGESILMDMKGKTLDKLTTGDLVVLKGQQYVIAGAPQIFITGGNLFSSGREQFAFVHIVQSNGKTGSSVS